MSRRAAADVLSWVKVEVDYALKLVRDSIARFSDAPDDVSTLQVCPSQLHQVTGALNIVGLDGATRICESIEKAFAGVGTGHTLSKKTAAVVDRAVLALKEFIDGLTKGEPNAPLKLFPVYRELAALQGKTDVSETDLFFPDLTADFPGHPEGRVLPAGELPAYLQNQRVRYQRGLLAWLRNPGESHGLREMRRALDALHQVALQLPEPRSLWWAATGLIDGFLHAPRPEWVANAKTMCGRIDLRIRDMAAGSQKTDEQLLRDVLYAVATCRPVMPSIREIKQRYQLDSLLSEPDPPGLMEFDMDWLRPALDDARSRLDAIKNTWVQYLSGEPNTLARFRELVSAFKTKAGDLGNPQLVRLLDVIVMVSTWLPNPYPRQSQVMVMEMTSAFLLMESILDSFTDPPTDLEQQVTITGGWVLDASKGKSTGQTPAGLRAEFSKLIDEMRLKAQVAKEIISNLQHVEQVLDAFSRDPGKRGTLPGIAPHLRQIHGALIILRFQRAADLLSICEKMISECAAADHPGTPQDMDWIAEGLSSLGFFLDPCLRGRPPAEHALELFFSRYEKRAAEPETRPETATEHAGPEAHASGPAEATPVPAPATAAREQAEAASEPVVPAEPPVEPAPPAPQSTPAAAQVNEELLQIFLEEAREVLDGIDQSLPACQQEPDNRDELTVIRRGFHTLKGSGRMVGLNDLGEIAWEIEQVLNRWLEEGEPATPELLELISAASSSFSTWIGQLKSREALQLDAQHILDLARQLKHAAGTGASTPPAPAPAIGEQPGSAPETPAIPTPDPEISIGNVRLSRAFYDIFLKEANQHVAALGAEFETWRAHPATDVSQEFMRAAHTLASISRTATFAPVASLAAAVEQWVPHAPITVGDVDVQVPADAITKLQEMLAEVSRQRFPENAAGEVARLQDLIARLRAAPPSAAPAVAQPLIAPAGQAPLPTPTSGSATVRAEAAAPLSKEQRAIRDDLDPQLLQIFLEEAQELLPLIGGDLREWKANPQDLQVSESLKRTLHTLKGSARMAGAMRLGELAHVMESRIESALGAGAPGVQLIEELEAQMDRLSAGIERLHIGDAGEAAAPAAATARQAVPQAEMAATAPAAMLRINADTVDWLVNESGEVSITRSRMESELASLKQSLLELNDSVARLRGQLREVEIQADSQMQSRQSVLGEGGHDFDPLEFDRYTRLQELTRIMAESLHDVTTIQQTLLKNMGEIDSALLQQGRINRDLQQELMRMRTVPFSNLNERLYRIVRQTSRDLGKKANLEIRGGQVELDRSVLERIGAPLEHMLRNAITHGLEDPDRRKLAGKPEIGEIAIALQQQSNEIVIIVSDDGAGLDLERLRSKALERGLIPADRDAGDHELIQLIFTSGFSTANEITELAGRGVGLDVVRSEIHAIGGRVDTATARGRGTTFTIYLPLTLAVTQAVMVRVGGGLFAISSAMVEQVLRLKPDELSALYERGAVEAQGHTYPLHYLSHLLGPAASAAEVQNFNSVLLLRSGIQRAAVHVDVLVGNQEIVVKNIGPQLSRVQGVTGATVLGDGRIVLIINPVQLATRPGGVSARSGAVPRPAAEKPAARVVMVVDDSITVRKITGRLLEREGYRVLTAKDGMDALEQIKEMLPDVMLVDIEMPRMDGFDLTRRLRGDPRTAHIPIIIISSRTAEKHRSRATELGANAFLGKPYQEAELLQHVSQYVSGGQQSVAYH